MISAYVFAPSCTHSMLKVGKRNAMESVMKYRIELEYAPYPLDKLWLEVSLTDHGAIDESGE